METTITDLFTRPHNRCMELLVLHSEVILGRLLGISLLQVSRDGDEGLGERCAVDLY